MNAALASLALALYQLVGLKSGPAQSQLEQTLLRARDQPTLEVTTAVSRPSLPTSLSHEPLTLGAASAYAVDLDTMTPLFSLNPTKQLPIASITKIGTALVVLKDHAPDQVLTIPALPPYSPNDALAHVAAGEQFRFDQLLAAALIPSANDAADSLAISESGGVEAFSRAMNNMISDWGITGVHYSNASGLNDTDNYATAQSLAQLAKLGLSSPLFAKITATHDVAISDIAGRSFSFKTTNELLGVDPRISGLKTGFTPAAGQCFVGLATIKSHKVITVILDSPDRFGETKQLLDWLERNWSWSD